MKQKSKKIRVFFICVALVLVNIIAYEPMRHNDFVDYDDKPYVTENPDVQAGLTRESVVRAFTSTLGTANWFPLTWISHMVDCELYGLEPGGHHFTSLVFHIVNMLLLLLVLSRMTGNFWLSAFVAAAFALHPLQVESVAWVAQRRSVLSGFFWLLTIGLYLRYTAYASIGMYLLVILSFTFGLMTKPVLVTLPFVLLLLDYWPLGRFQLRRQKEWRVLSHCESAELGGWLANWHLIAEKIPLLALAVASSIVTYITQYRGGSVTPTEFLPLSMRLSNTLVSYIRYVGKMIYPTKLAVLYPFRQEGLGIWRPFVSFVILAAVSVVVVRMARKQRYLLVGWFWFLGTLVPVIGLVQVGSQAMADRYVYLPLIGFFLMVAWAASELLVRWRFRRIVLQISAIAVIGAMLTCTRLQLRHWQDSLSLYEHTLEVTENNSAMHYNYGTVLYKDGQLDEACKHYIEALRIRPRFAQAHINLGLILASKGRIAEATRHYTEALRIDPESVGAHRNLGNALLQQGKLKEAVICLTRALAINPELADAHSDLGYALAQQGKGGEAMKHFSKAIQLKPDWVDPMNNLAWFLATYKGSEFYNPAEAIRLSERACELTDYSQPNALDTLATAYAAAGKFTQAVRTAEKALQLALSLQETELAEEIRERLRLYRAGQCYTEPSLQISSD